MSKTFTDAVETRRSIYGISKEAVLSDDKIIGIVRHAVTHAPSAFNSQGARVLLLLGGEHDKLWDVTKTILQKIVPPEAFPETEQKLNAFRSGYGTVLFFEEQNTVRTLQQKFPLYQDNFPIWSLESAGMLQYIVWTALEAEGFGASLQHYNPLIDETVKTTWSVPQSWKLLGQMPFGKPIAPPNEKTFLPVEDRVIIYK